MKHVHAGTCDECGRDFYVVINADAGTGTLGTVFMYHLDQPCVVHPSAAEIGLSTTD